MGTTNSYREGLGSFFLGTFFSFLNFFKFFSPLHKIIDLLACGARWISKICLYSLWSSVSLWSKPSSRMQVTNQVTTKSRCSLYGWHWIIIGKKILIGIISNH